MRIGGTLVDNVGAYQRDVTAWCKKTFEPIIAEVLAPPERSRRFLEESLELCQSVGMTKEHALQLVEYVFGRPKGEPSQEVGGVMVTFAVFCETLGINLGEEGLRELRRIDTPELIEKIRNKQVSKQLHGVGGTPIERYEDVSSGAGEVNR